MVCSSIVGLVVEFVVAIDEARVRFTDDALLFFHFFFVYFYNSSLSPPFLFLALLIIAARNNNDNSQCCIQYGVYTAGSQIVSIATIPGHVGQHRARKTSSAEQERLLFDSTH